MPSSVAMAAPNPVCKILMSTAPVWIRAFTTTARCAGGMAVSIQFRNYECLHVDSGGKRAPEELFRAVTACGEITGPSEPARRPFTVLVATREKPGHRL